MDASRFIRSSEGAFVFAVRSATQALLTEILSPTVPFVWLINYMPNARMEWWTMPIVLRRNGIIYEAKVRGACFDLLVETGDFLKMLPEISDSSFTLMQMHKPVPNTFPLNRLSNANRAATLKKNGWHLSCHSPHGGEVSIVTAPRREILEQLLLGVEVRKEVLEA